MPHVFISYARQDYDFAENLATRLKGKGVSLWKDIEALEGGQDWRAEIDAGIRGASALVAVMSSWAAESQYVTYEWAFALGAGIPVIPLRLHGAELHPRLEALQYMDFSRVQGRPWEQLIRRLMTLGATGGTGGNPNDEELERAAHHIMNYLMEKTFTRVSFEAVREHINPSYSDEFLLSMIERMPDRFMRAPVNGVKPGVARLTSRRVDPA